ncbi:MAG TPA: Uma2 family endonuclease [Candidatus Binatia bacterium]|nr:Uma2 family endonuclease [Candidatus Binatia bacterium]
MSGTRVQYPRGRRPGELTYEDYCALPDDSLRYEVVEGLLFAEPSPRRAHQRAVGRLFAVLDGHVRARGLGEVFIAPFDVILSPRTVVVPDLVFVAAGRSAIVSERGIEGAPDLIVEVLSGVTRRRDRVVKAGAYARHGVPHYWVLDPEDRTLEAFELVRGAYSPAAALEGDRTFEPALFPGLAIPLAGLWR